MLSRLTGLFRDNKGQKRFTEEQHRRHDLLKDQGLEKVLGKMYDMVWHAIIPFSVGGAVDMYCYPNTMDGTGFVTKELIEPDGTGPRPSRIGTYEFVAFTRYRVGNQAESEAFERIQNRVWSIFTRLGYYSREAVLNPGETAEVPAGEGLPNYCVLFDRYERPGVEFMIGKRRHGLLLVIQVFRTEMLYAMENGSQPVLEKLKEKGHYPYSDLDRLPVA